MEFRNPFGAHRNVGIPVEGRTWTEERVEGEDLAGVIFQNCVFDRVRFEGANLTQTVFLNSRIDDCVFDACELVQTRWFDCKGSGLAISGGELFVEATFAEVRFARLVIGQMGRQLVLGESEIEQLQFDGAGCSQESPTISGCKFTSIVGENAAWNNGTAVELDLSACSFKGAKFERCSFIRSVGRGVDLSGVTFSSCNLYQSDFSEARIRQAEQSIFAECQLESTNFREAALDGALFAKANAPGACFDGAHLQGTMFPKAILTGASFAGAFAPQSVWTNADLSDASLVRLNAPGAVFRNVSFAGADVEGARFVKADLHGVEESLTGADLRDSRGTVDWRAERQAEARRQGE